MYLCSTVSIIVPVSVQIDAAHFCPLRLAAGWANQDKAGNNPFGRSTVPVANFCALASSYLAALLGILHCTLHVIFFFSFGEPRLFSGLSFV